MSIPSTVRVASLQDNCDCIGYIENRDASPLLFPALYSLELTPACNNRCPGCGNTFIEDTQSRSLQQKQAPLRVDQWEDILDTITPYARRLAITGGEPTLHPDFAQIIQAIEHRFLPFTLFTNGRWGNPERIITILQRSTQCVGLLISLHGANQEAHEHFTGVAGSFAETVHHIQRVTSAGLRVHTNTVLTRLNCNQVEAIVHLSRSLGADYAVFNRYIGTSCVDFDCSSFELRQALHKVGQHDNATKVGTCVPLCFTESSTVGCSAGTAFCTIDPWGHVRPCNHSPHIAGNLIRETLETIWQSEVMQDWRSMVPETCSTCNVFSTCRGGCRADAILKGLACDPLIAFVG